MDECREEELTERITLGVDDDGNLQVNISAWNVWQLMTGEQKELVYDDSAHWSIIKNALHHELGRGVSGPHFNNSLHKLREMICSDPELVNNIVVSLVSELLRQWGIEEQKRRKAEKAYWGAYHGIDHNIMKDYPSPSSIGEKGDHLRFTSEEVKDEMIAKFGDLMKDLRGRE